MFSARRTETRIYPLPFFILKDAVLDLDYPVPRTTFIPSPSPKGSLLGMNSGDNRTKEIEMNLENLAVVGLVLSLSSWLTRRLLVPVSRLYLLDHPNGRSLHSTPIPRTGGLAILGSLAVGLLLEGSRAFLGDAPQGAYTEASLWISGMLLLIAAISFWDDRTGVPPGLRLGVHALAAAGVVLGAGLIVESIAVPLLGTLPLGWMAAPLTIVCLIWMTNLYNFMDGMDGFAGGMSVIGFGFLSILAWTGGHSLLAFLSLLTAGAAAGFSFTICPRLRFFWEMWGAFCSVLRPERSP